MIRQTTLHPNLENFSRAFKYGWYIETEKNETIETIARDPDRYIELRLSPSSISVDEPFATSVQPTQDGGKFIERRGWTKKIWTVNGSTGFLPPGSSQNTRGSLPQSVIAALPPGVSVSSNRATQPKRSGFAEFHRLRNLFARFMDLSSENKHVRMFYMNFKDDEFWEIEPTNFRRPRTAQKPFTYEYTLQFQGIQPADRVAQQTRDQDVIFINSASPQVAIGRLINRVKELKSINQKIANLTAGKMQIATQLITQSIEDVIAVAVDVRDGFTIGANIPLNTFRQFASSINACLDVLGTSGLTRPVELEINAFLVESRKIAEGLMFHANRVLGNQSGSAMAKANINFTQPRGRSGSSTDLFAEEPGSSGSLNKNGITGQSGLGQVIDLQKFTTSTRTVGQVIPHGWDIYDCASKMLGSIHLFMVLVITNRLEYPYIVERADNKPSGTLAWGERIEVPVSGDAESSVDGSPIDLPSESFSSTVTAVGLSNQLVDSSRTLRDDELVGFTLTMLSGIASSSDASRVVVANTSTVITLNREWQSVPGVGDTYTVVLDQFSLRKPANALTKAYGRDLLLVFDNFTGIGGMVGDIRLNVRGDLAMIEGEENFEQAMSILTNTPKGANRFHPGYGLGLVIGQKMDETMQLLFAFCLRQSILRDPRVDRVLNAQYDVEQGVASFRANVQPIGAKTTKSFRRTV